MLGVFDSGHGGLTVMRALGERFPGLPILYLGDHANAPYGNRPSAEIVNLTREGVETLFARGARLVLLGCNTATCVAARRLQQTWLPSSPWARITPRRNVLGIVAPTVEVATQTPWAVTTPQYPQKYNSDLIVVFGTTRTITSDAYREEIQKRCPKATVVQEISAELAGAIETGSARATLDQLVAASVSRALARLNGQKPDRVILGCTHFPLVEDLFRVHLPEGTRILSQPDIVANSLEDYLTRHPHFATGEGTPGITLYTTGNVAEVNRTARIFWPGAPAFRALT